MVKVSVEVKSNHFGAIAAKLPGRSRALVQETVQAVEAQAKARVPVDTGALKASITGRMVGPTEGEVATGQEYAYFVEAGTRHAPAQPYMTPAAEAVRPQFEAGARKLIEGL